MMKKISFTPVLLVIAMFVSACSVMPKSTSSLDQTRKDYFAAQNNQNVAKYAQVEMRRATELMMQADTAASRAEDVEKIDQLAYLTSQQIALAQEVAKRKSAESAVSHAGEARDRVRLDQRADEAEQAQLQAQASAEQSALAALAVQTETLMLELSAQATTRGTVIIFSDLLFDSGQTRLNVEGMRAVQKLSHILQINPYRIVQIEGFTDNKGSAVRNLELSEGRASEVRNALQDMGVVPQRIAIRGYGAAHPLTANNSEANRQLNRRVEIVFSDDKGLVAPR